MFGVPGAGPHGPGRFTCRTRALLGARALALSVVDGSSVHVLASDGTTTTDVSHPPRVLRDTRMSLDAAGWLHVPVRRPAGPVLGFLHIVPGPAWNMAEVAEAMGIAAETAVAVVAPVPSSTANLPELMAAKALNRLAVSAQEYPALLTGIAAAIAPVVDTTKVGVALWSESRRYLQSLPRSFGAEDAMAASSQVDGTHQHSGAARVWRTGRTLYSNSPRTDLPDFRDWIDAFGIQQLMTTPLCVGDKAVGVLHIANHRVGFDAQSEAAVESVAPFVASCVTTVRDRIELRRNEAMSEVISRTATAVALGESLESVGAEAFPTFCRIAEIRMLVVSFGDDRGPRITAGETAVNSELARQFLAEAVRPRVAARSRLLRPTGAGDAGSSSLHVPVVAAGSSEATLSVLRVPGTPFSRQEQEAIRRLANIVALALVTERYEQERSRRERMQERQRIADDLHDYVAQALFAGKLTLHSVIEDLPPDAPVRPTLTRAHDLVVRGEESLRQAIHQLAAPEDGVDIETMLRTVAREVEHEFGVPIHLALGSTAVERTEQLSVAAIRALVKTARELLVNAAKHAVATRISVTLRARRDRVSLVVEDDGTGFAPTSTEGYGLRSTRRHLRGVRGLLRISRSKDRTRVLVSVPVVPALRTQSTKPRGQD